MYLLNVLDYLNRGVSYDTYVGAINKAKGNATQQKQKDRENSLDERRVDIQDKVANAASFSLSAC